MDDGLTRRTFLKQATALAVGTSAGRAMGAVTGDEQRGDKERGMSDEKRAYLDTITPTREMAERFTAVRDGWSHYDAELGWLPTNGQIKNGVDDSVTFYQYDKADRGRRVVNFPERKTRVMTFGDSFTHCDQVSDGETWQEYLAAHLQEPIRNFGVGGHSVYQALRNTWS
jgi:hypothetical protein